MNFNTPNPISTITNATALIWAFIILATNPTPLSSVVAFLLVALSWTSAGFHYMEDNNAFTEEQQHFWQKADVISIYAVLCCTIAMLLGKPILLPLFALAAGLLATVHRSLNSFLVIRVLFVFIVTLLALHSLQIAIGILILFALAFTARQLGERSKKGDLYHGGWHVLAHSGIGLIAVIWNSIL